MRRIGLFSGIEAGALVLASPALAGWGENWGTMVWGAAPVGVPTLGLLGLGLLSLALAAGAVFSLRRRAWTMSVLLVALAIPLAAVASPITGLNVFSNGTTADANKVNANFDAVEAAVNDNDSRVGALEASALPATIDASGVNLGNHLDVTGNLTSSGSEGGIITANRGVGTIVIDPTDVSSGYTATLSLDDQGIKLGHNSSARDIQFQTANTTKMTISRDGDVSIAGNITFGAGTANLTSHFGNANAHHVRYSGAEALAAMGTLQNSNALNHVRYSDAEVLVVADTAGYGPDTTLDETQVDAFVANNGFGLEADVSANTAAITALGGEVTGLQACPDGLTVADHDTGLLWEKKTGTYVSLPGVLCQAAGCPDPHDVVNVYEWSNVSPNPNGGAFTNFLAKLNDSSQPATWSSSSSGSVGTQTSGCFADHCDWRLPNIVELQTILGCNFGGPPCIDPLFGPTAPAWYWSAASNATDPARAWDVNFAGGNVSGGVLKTAYEFVRAVRAGSCTE